MLARTGRLWFIVCAQIAWSKLLSLESELRLSSNSPVSRPKLNHYRRIGLASMPILRFDTCKCSVLGAMVKHNQILALSNHAAANV